MLGYVRSKRREKKKPNMFTHLLYEEEKREWGAIQKKHSLTLQTISGLRSVQVSLPFGGPLYDGRLPVPLSCALCSMEQSSISSLCSSSDVHFAIEEESDSGTADGAEEGLKGGTDNCEDFADILKERFLPGCEHDDVTQKREKTSAVGHIDVSSTCRRRGNHFESSSFVSSNIERRRTQEVRYEGHGGDEVVVVERRTRSEYRDAPHLDALIVGGHFTHVVTTPQQLYDSN
ncbi:hypothetical protein JZ751_017179 [Albula glossodonta]|uniref:Uncharacterized protein n=1 Tax=Albula glossodonta TaxID=121402 RepID=A0A8T2NPM2_9TELE|nr:hypothetical protein JZ751_017179 [Albula glossodonta]